jgi:hypothetical protein
VFNENLTLQQETRELNSVVFPKKFSKFMASHLQRRQKEQFGLFAKTLMD